MEGGILLLRMSAAISVYWYIEIGVALLVIVGSFIFYRISRESKGRTTTEVETGRTLFTFESEAGLWEMVSQWAKKHRYKLIEETMSRRKYKKKPNSISTFFMVPQIQVTCTAGKCELQVWLMTRRIGRIINPALTVLPTEISIDEDSFIRRSDWWPLSPGRIARRDANALVRALNQWSPQIS